MASSSTVATDRPHPSHGHAIASLLIVLAVIAINALWNRFIYTTTTDLLLLSWISQVGLCFLLPVVWELAVSRRGFASLGLIWLEGWKDLRLSLLISAAILIYATLVLGPKQALGGMIGGELDLSWMLLYALASLFTTVCVFGWCLQRWAESWGRIAAIPLAGFAYGYLMSGDGRFRLGLFLALSCIGMVLAYLVHTRKSLLVAWPIPPAFAGLLMAQTTVEEVTSATLWELAMFARVTVPVALVFVILVTLILRGIWPRLCSVMVGGLYALVIGITLFGWSREIPLRTAQMAKYVCSGVFVSGRPAKTIQKDDMSFIRHVDVVIDRKRKTVAATYLGLGKRLAIYRERLGCTLTQGRSTSTLRKRARIVQKLPPPRRRKLRYDKLTDPTLLLARQKLQELVTPLLVKQKGKPDPGTKAVVVLHKGRLLFERYAEGYTAKTPLLGHSLTKTVTGALAGILIHRGKLSLEQRILTGDAAQSDADRKRLKVRHLLHMTSGLSFSESYLVPFSDLTVMLYGVPDGGTYAMGLDLSETPGKRWRYETGTAMLLSLAIRNAFGKRQAAYQRFPHKALFRPLGMRSAVLEQDASGTYLGGSHMYATARDWARFGQLYLDNGRAGSRQILSSTWINFTKTPISRAPLGIYGALMWLNGGAPSSAKKPTKHPRLSDWLALPQRPKTRKRLFPKLPHDAFFAIGYGGQIIAVFPSHHLVVVRMSHGMDESWGIPQHHTFLTSVLQKLQPLKDDT